MSELYDVNVVMGDTESFKDVRGALRFNTLFLEENDREGYSAVFTLRPKAIGECPSLRELFLSYDDPTEYHFATDIFGSITYWEEIASKGFMKKHITEWRAQAEARRRSGVFVQMDSILKHEDSKDTAKIAAGKVMLNEVWKLKGVRPTKEAKKAQVLKLVKNGVSGTADDVLSQITKRNTR